MSLLDKIENVRDLKKIDISMLDNLAKEIREIIIEKTSIQGGHLGSNLASVELIIAMHYVFNAPTDKIIFDVSHQSYTHKILTSRKNSFLNKNEYDDVTEYTNPLESEYDLFTVGHASTSIALAIGMDMARKKNNENYNVIAFIGDASLTGGEALEGLNYAGEYEGKIVIILNDNEHSITENHGGIYKNLAQLRESSGKCSNNIFVDIGLNYIYEENGHDTKKLVETLIKAKNMDKSVVVHVHTVKGKGYTFAENDKDKFHEIAPFDIETGIVKMNKKGMDITVFKALKKLLDNDRTAVIYNAATPLAFGFVKEYRDLYSLRGQFVDVGIAEEMAVTMAAAARKAGLNSVLVLLAPFFQRAYDQVFHDVALNNIPMTMLVLYPGVYEFNSNTHLALSDIQMFSHIPNILYLAPTTRDEFNRMFKFAVYNDKRPVAIRVMKEFPVKNKQDNVYKESNVDYDDFQTNIVERKGSRVALFAVGVLMNMALKVYDEIKTKLDFEITVVNPRFINDIDEKFCHDLIKNHDFIISIEDGELQSGYGQILASFYGQYDVKVMNLGITKKFHNKFKAEELLAQNGISVDKLTKLIVDYLKDNSK